MVQNSVNTVCVKYKIYEPIGKSFVTSLFTFCLISIHFQVEKETTEDKIKLNIKFKKASRGKYWTKLSVLYMQFLRRY